MISIAVVVISVVFSLVTTLLVEHFTNKHQLETIQEEIDRVFGDLDGVQNSLSREHAAVKQSLSGEHGILGQSLLRECSILSDAIERGNDDLRVLRDDAFQMKEFRNALRDHGVDVTVLKASIDALVVESGRSYKKIEELREQVRKQAAQLDKQEIQLDKQTAQLDRQKFQLDKQREELAVQEMLLSEQKDLLTKQEKLLKEQGRSVVEGNPIGVESLTEEESLGNSLGKMEQF